jgi:hypothetical protein
MFSVSWVATIILLIITLCIFIYAAKNSQAKSWGQGIDGLKFTLAKSFLQVVDFRYHTKNWRPQILVLTGCTVSCASRGAAGDNSNADDALKTTSEDTLVIHDMPLIHLASQFKAGKGLCIVGAVIDTPNLGKGSFLARLEYQAIKNWNDIIQASLLEIGISGFAQTVYASHREEGILGLIQTAGEELNPQRRGNFGSDSDGG